MLNKIFVDSIKIMEFIRKVFALSWWKKSLIFIIVVSLSVVGYHYSYLLVPVSQIEFKETSEWLNEKPRSQAEVERYFTALEEAYRKDDIGGETPQETLALWVEAVKEGNLEKASTYFLVEYRSGALERMEESKKNSVLPDIIADIEDGGTWKESENLGASFESTIDGTPGYYFEFTKNPYTGVWKLDEF